MDLNTLEQQSKEWLDWRLGKIGASDAPVILGLSPYKTRWELWMEKLRLPIPRTSSKPQNNFAIQRGNNWEPKVRALYELESGLELPASIKVHPKFDFIMASLDGYDEKAGVVLEIKCAGQEVFQMAEEGIVHPKYYPQVQQQLMVTGAKECHFLVAKIGKKGRTEFIEDTATVIVKPDEEFQKNLLFELVSFWDLVKKRVRPPLTERDFMICDDQNTVMLFSRMKAANEKLNKYKEKASALVDRLSDLNQQIKDAEMELNIIKQDAISHAEEVLRHNKIHAIGVSMVKYKRGGWKFFMNDSGEASEEN